jgi:hypothetical protein
MGMGLRFEQESHWDDGICAQGQWDLVKIWAGKWEYDPPFRTLIAVRDKFIDTDKLILFKTYRVYIYVRKSMHTQHQWFFSVTFSNIVKLMA